MAEIVKNLGSTPAVIPATVTTMYTAPTGTSLGAIIKECRVTNYSATTACYFILYKNGTAGLNQITGQITLQPNETYTDPGPIVLGTGGTLRAIAQFATNLTLSLGGLEIA